MSRPLEREVIENLKAVVLIVRNLVDHPEEVEVNVVPSATRLLIELYTNPEDVGQVIGGGGRVISSLRNLVGAFAGKHRIRIELEYVTEHEKERIER